MGVPGFAGFISKWNLTEAAVNSDNPLAYLGVAALLVSALLTAIYMLSVVRRAFFPATETGCEAAAADPGWQMCLPLILCAAASALLGLFSQPLMELLQAVAWGML
jgi:multicomponent Na+:H+ antiporter subunit D